MSDAREALVEVAYMQIATEKMLTITPTGPGRASVPPHWRSEAEERAKPWIDAILAAGWTPPAARCCDPETIETRIDGDWLVDVHQHHTCGTGPNGHYGAHEPGCGEVPVVNLRGLPGWTPPGERVKPTVEDVARAILMATQAADVDPDYAWNVQYPEVQDELLDQARAVLALIEKGEGRG